MTSTVTRLLALFLSLASAPLLATSSGVQRGEQLDIELISERDAVVAGESVWLALRIEHDPHWHTYWINPGDSGLATRIEWSLPDGFQAGEIVWPYPERLPIGPLVNFGYEGETWLLTELSAPTSLPAPGTELSISAEVHYLVCELECIPGRNTLHLRMPVAASAGPVADQAAGFERARLRNAQLRADLGGRIAESGGQLEVVLSGPLPEQFELFPIQDGLFNNHRFENWRRHQDGLVTEHARSDWYNGLPAQVPMLLVDRGSEPARAYEIALTGAGKAVINATADTTDAAAASDAAAPTQRLNSLTLALLLAFAGGVILNLMPCVFPVLTMKALTLAQSGGDRRRARREGNLYTLGVLVSFAVIGATLLALRAGGEQIGWGFQLQSPWLVAALVYVLFALGLSLSGVLTIGSGWMNLGQRLTEGGGDRAAFFTGVLACVVAAPCTAPFMGAALGYALTQPPVAAMSVFLALGLGLAAPLALLAWLPVLARRLPRPGPWMETFKQVLAFPMYLVAVWLLWVLAHQTGADGVGIALVGLVLLAFGLWSWQRAQWRGSIALKATAVVALALAVLALPLPQQLSTIPAGAASSDARWQTWTPQRLDELRSIGQPVLVNMTAAWCITCLANERVALSSDAFYERLRRHGITYLKGDWTSYDSDITAYLTRFDRAGVPLYVLYPRGTGTVQVLPQLLTPTAVLEALDLAAGP